MKAREILDEPMNYIEAHTGDENVREETLEALRKGFEAVIGEDDTQKPNDEDYGGWVVCDTCEVIIDPELKEYECNCKLRNQLKAEQRERLDKFFERGE